MPSLLQTPNFRSFWIGETISVVGDQLTLLAMPLVAILALDADARDMGTLTAVSLLPHLLFSLPAGVWLEQVHVRKRVTRPNRLEASEAGPDGAVGARYSRGDQKSGPGPRSWPFIPAVNIWRSTRG